MVHHAVRSIQQLCLRSESLGPIVVEHVRALAESVDLRAVVTQPLRRLRNGWFHLSLGDIATVLSDDSNILTPVSAYGQMEVPVFAELVDRGLDQVANGIGTWLAEPGADGSRLIEHLHLPAN